MAKRPRNRFRWPFLLAEALLLQGLLAAAVHSADRAGPADAAAVDAGAYAPGIDFEEGALGGGDGDLYLEVAINGAAGGLAHFIYRDGGLWASKATLHGLGFALPAYVADTVRLDSIPRVSAHYDRVRQQAAITAPIEMLNLPVTHLNAPSNTVPRTSSSPGVLLNYDLFTTVDPNGTASFSAFTELRAFNAAGVFSTTELTRALHIGAAGWQDSTVRLDSTWSQSFPEDMLTVRIGDTLTDALSWSRSTRIGGIQLSRNFALQPYRVTTPLPAFFGAVAMPSDIELYINGVRQYSGQVPAGPFQLNSIPNINGAGTAQVVITDALGRGTTLNFPLYDSQQLLQRGLSDWSAELGVVREDYGLRSFAYGHDPVGSGTWRYGVSDAFTAEAHAEATDGLIDAGGGGALRLGQAGVLSGSAARSQYRGRTGSQFSVGYDWRSNRFNLGFNGIRNSGDYRDLASLYGGALPQISARASAGINAGSLGSFGISYLHLRYSQTAATRYASASWFKSVGRQFTLNLSVNQNLNDHRDNSIYFGATFALGRDTTLSAGATYDHDRAGVSVDASHPAPSEGGFGWRANARTSEGQSGGAAELDYLGPYGRVDAGASALGDSRFTYASASGGIVLMGGHVFAARRIDDAFALVSTDGVAGVPVQLENRPIGVTDEKGMLLVSRLNAYQDNRLSIDPMQLPADIRIDRVRATATPGDRAGTLVRFGITPIRAASIVLVDREGKPLPLGSAVRVNGEGHGALVGFDGAVYVDTLQDRNVIDVATPVGNCRARFDDRGHGGTVAQIGPLQCAPEHP